jgi:hypothetical protein
MLVKNQVFTDNRTIERLELMCNFSTKVGLWEIMPYSGSFSISIEFLD